MIIKWFTAKSQLKTSLDYILALNITSKYWLEWPRYDQILVILVIHLSDISPGSSRPDIFRLSPAQLFPLNVDLHLPRTFTSLLFVFLLLHPPSSPWCRWWWRVAEWPCQPRTLPLLSPVRIIQLRKFVPNWLLSYTLHTWYVRG